MNRKNCVSGGGRGLKNLEWLYLSGWIGFSRYIIIPDSVDLEGARNQSKCLVGIRWETNVGGQTSSNEVRHVWPWNPPKIEPHLYSLIGGHFGCLLERFSAHTEISRANLSRGKTAHAIFLFLRILRSMRWRNMYSKAKWKQVSGCRVHLYSIKWFTGSKPSVV